LPRGLAADLPVEHPSLPVLNATPQSGSATVLHIEDDPGVALSMTMLLQLEGYKVVSAATRDEALQHIEVHGVRPDLVLCDFNLPMGFTGDQIIAEIALALGYKPPTIMLTGDIAERHVAKAKLVAERILPKPADINRLLREIDNLLSTRH
jgi:two-component system CheB/CheR fusion protein